MFAARYGLSDLVRELLVFGADPNLNRSPDSGALGIAAGEGHSDIVSLLLEAGADVSHRNREGRSALDLAQEGGHGEIAAVLRRRIQQGAGEP
jgi:ankyrin repeat protein